MIASPHELEAIGQTLKQALAPGSSEKKSTAIAHHGAAETDEVDRPQIEFIAAGQEPGHQQNGLFRHGQAEISEEDEGENPPIAPRG